VPAPAPAVSVVIPTWNRASDVVGAVECVLAQEGPDLEVLVVDDGSTDGTGEALAARFPGEPRLRVIRQENGGTARARNTGLAAARGRYVALLDSDDRWLPGYLAAQVEALERAPEAALAVGDAYYVDREGRTQTTYLERVHGRAPTSLEDMLRGGWALPSCWLLRTEVLQALRFDPAWKFEDTEFLFRFFAAGHRSVVTPVPRARYVVADAGDGAPRKMAAERLAKAEQLRLMEAYADRAQDPRAHAVRLERGRTLALSRAGRWREALPHAWKWWKGAPWRLRPLLIALRGVFSRRVRDAT
jgi:glycosyltransferase involved in cell wall biosynthesis